MTSATFDFEPLLPAGLPAPAARWAGLAKYSFIGGNNDPDQVPVEGLIDAVNANHIDLVYCCGPLMRNLWDALSTGKRGGYADSADTLESQLVGAIRAGDAIMVKGSLGSKMKTIVNALEKRFPGKAAHDEAAV